VCICSPGRSSPPARCRHRWTGVSATRKTWKTSALARGVGLQLGLERAEHRVHRCLHRAGGLDRPGEQMPHAAVGHLEPRDRDVADAHAEAAAVGQLAAAPGVKRALAPARRRRAARRPRGWPASRRRRDRGEVARHDDQTRDGEYAVATSPRSSIAPTRSPCFALVTRLISFHSSSAMTWPTLHSSPPRSARRGDRRTRFAARSAPPTWRRSRSRTFS